MKAGRFFLILVLFLCVFVSACSSDDDDDDNDADDDDNNDAVDDDDDDDDDDNDDDNNDDDDDDDDNDTTPSGPLSLSVVTYNVLFDFPNPDYDSWRIRKEHVSDIINAHEPDLVGFQEPLVWQMTDLRELCPGYVEHSLDVHTDSALFFREDRFELLDKGHFWHSPWPNVPFSIGFGNFLPRNVLWVKLYDKQSGVEFFFFDTHFDNTAPFQENAAPQFLDLMEEIIAGSPVVVTGDFNSKPDREAYRILTEGNTPGGFALTNTFDLAPGYDVRLAPGDEREYDPDHRIDHIFVAEGDWDSSYWVVDMTRYGDPWRDPSDHFAMATDIELTVE